MISAKYLPLAIILMVGSSWAHQSINLMGVYIEWQNLGTQTEFYVTSDLSQINDVGDSWLAIGVNSEPKMTGTNAVVCRNSESKTAVEHYINSEMYKKPVLMDSGEPLMGLTNSRISMVQSSSNNRTNVTCSFKRENSNSTDGYIQIDANSTLYLIVAFGEGDLGYHGVNKKASETMVTFPVPEIPIPEFEPTETIVNKLSGSTQASSSTVDSKLVETAEEEGSLSQENQLDPASQDINSPSGAFYQLFIDFFNWIVSLIFRAG